MSVNVTSQEITIYNLAVNILDILFTCIRRKEI